MPLIRCFVCNDEPEYRPTCTACNGQGQIMDGGDPAAAIAVPTERFAVTGKLTRRVIVTWPDGRETHVYPPA